MYEPSCFICIGPGSFSTTPPPHFPPCRTDGIHIETQVHIKTHTGHSVQKHTHAYRQTHNINIKSDDLHKGATLSQQITLLSIQIEIYYTCVAAAAAYRGSCVLQGEWRCIRNMLSVMVFSHLLVLAVSYHLYPYFLAKINQFEYGNLASSAPFHNIITRPSSRVNKDVFKHVRHYLYFLMLMAYAARLHAERQLRN